MMPDREKVIERLEKVSYYFKSLLAVGWQGDADIYREHRESVNMAIALLKKQEPVMLENQHKPYGNSLNANAPWISRCPKCGKKVEGKQTRYCKYCGQAVKWE